MNIFKAIKLAASSLDGVCDNPVLEAEVLLAHLLGIERWRLHLHPEMVLDAEKMMRFKEMVARRARGEPVAHILGYREFWSRDFKVTPDTLVPRPETELLVETALELAHESCGTTPFMLDAGTGSGVIAVTLALEMPGARVVATDISSLALEVAQENIARHGVGKRVFPLRGWWLTPFKREAVFHMVVSNPPYIATREKELMSAGVSEFEPEIALFAGSQGLDAVSELMGTVGNVLKTGGWFLCEIGCFQGEAARKIARASGWFSKVEIRKDLAGLDRLLVAQRC